MNTDALYPSMAPPAAPEPVAESLIPSAPVQPAAPKPAAEPPAAPPLSEEARLEGSGARLFNKEPEAFVDQGVPEEVAKLREADPNRRMFNAQETYKTDIPLSLFEKIEGDDITPEVREYAAGVWREVAADLELAPADVRELIPALQERPTPEQQAQNRADSLRWLVAEHGDSAGHVLELARALVARDPRTAALLDFGGGDNPKVIKKVVAAALRQAASGKLKLKK